MILRSMTVSGAGSRSGGLQLQGRARSFAVGPRRRVHGPRPQRRTRPRLRALRGQRSDRRGARHHHRRYEGKLPLPRAAGQARHPLRRVDGRRGVRLDRHGEGRPQGRVAALDAAGRNDRALAASASRRRRHERAARKIRSARARSISTRAIATRSIASTAPTSPRRSAATSRPAASACATSTWSTSTTARRSARRSSSAEPAFVMRGRTSARKLMRSPSSPD